MPERYGRLWFSELDYEDYDENEELDFEDEEWDKNEEEWRKTHIFKSPEEESYDKGYNQALEDVKGYLSDSLTKEQLEIINCLKREE